MSDWYGTGSNVKVLMREFERNNPFGEIYPPRHYDIEGRDILDVELERAFVIYQENQRKLNASRDTRAIRASNANTVLLIDALRKISA